MPRNRQKPAVHHAATGCFGRVGGCRDFKFQVCAPAPNIRVFPFYKALSRGFSAGGLLLYVTFFLLCSFASEVRAGDILRGGASGASGRKSADARANAGAQAAEIAKTKAVDRLAQTTKIINDMRQMQAEARSAAGAANIPNGLQPGGLQVLQNGDVTGISARWDGANAPVQAGNLVTIKQNQQQAVLHWKTFNVGKSTTVNFDQTAGGTDSGKWIAFNKIFDPSGKPSQILGSIKADGQVYVINQNGIIFGAGSQVNTRTFVASTLPINDNLVNLGLLNNRDAQFLFSSLDVPGGTDGTPAFQPSAPVAGSPGDVVVQTGATISSPTGTSGNGGRIMLVGRNVTNGGTLSTPEGQTILAAGLQVGVQAHAQSDPSLRGLDVWVGAADASTGKVINQGIIDSPTGSILLAGREIQQNGALNSSTSVSLNGRIDLIASYGAVGNPNFDNSGALGYGLPIFVSQFTGTVDLGAKSVTAVLPEYSDTKSIPGSQLPEASQINIVGLGIHAARGSFLTATGGNILIQAGKWTYVDPDANGTVLTPGGAVEPGFPSNFQNGAQKLLFSTGQIYFDSGSTIDVSGTPDAFVPLAQNIVDVQLRGSELADSPLQRSSGIRGKSLTVDLRLSGSYSGREWVGTPLGDLTGIAGLTERNVSQLTTKGGSLTFQAGEAIVVQNGATLDVSGGYFRNEGGMVKTTQLLRGGNLVNISQATPDLVYSGIYSEMSTSTSAKWGVSKAFVNALSPTGGYNQSSFNEGASGGSLNLKAPVLVLSGNLLGQTVTGPLQLDSPPASSSLKISFRGEQRLALSQTDISYLDTSPFHPSVQIVNVSPHTEAAPYSVVSATPVPVDGTATTHFDIGSDIYNSDKSGFGKLEIDNPDGKFDVSSSVNVAVPAGGSLVVSSSNARIEGHISAPGGTVSIKTYNFSPFEYQYLSATGALLTEPAPAHVAGRGDIVIGTTGFVDVSGMLIDERPTSSAAFATRRSMDAGSATFEGYNMSLEKGGRILASAGAKAQFTGGFSYGKAGSISLLAGKDPALSTTIGGRLSLDGTVEAYAVGTGGSLTLQSTLMQIGGTANDPQTVVLDPQFFQQGGFGSYTVRGIGKSLPNGTNIPAVAVSAGTVVNPFAKSWVRLPNGSHNNDLAFTPILKPEGDRSPASLSIVGIGSDDPFTTGTLEALGLVFLGEGSAIKTDAGANVSITGDAVVLLGSIIAPGGTVAVAGRSEYRLPDDLKLAASFAIPTVHIGNAATIDVSGTTVLKPDPYGRRRGTVYSGGTIHVSGNIFAEQGALLDASGASGTLDLDPAKVATTAGGMAKAGVTNGVNRQPWGRTGIATRIDSNGGLIDLEGSQMLYSDATLRGFAGGPTATAGTLSVSSGRFYSFGASRKGSDINLVVTQSGNAAAFAGLPSAIQDVGLFLHLPDLGTLFTSAPTNSGAGYFSLLKFEQGGFSSLDLGYKYYSGADPIPYGGNVEFRGAIALNAAASVRLAAGGIVKADSSVRISAPYIAVGQKFSAPLNPADTFFAFQQYPVPTAGQAYYPQPTYGPASLSLEASWLDVGTLSLQNIGRAALTANHGDIRGSGTLSMVGDLTLTAAQIYPTTLANFSIVAYDPAGGKSHITILPSGTRSPPLSAGGTLSIFASNISQKGVLRAPLGSIFLGWDGTDFDPSTPAFDQPTDFVGGPNMTIPTAQTVRLEAGSITSVSAINPETGKGLRIPFGLSADGLSWTDPRGVDVTIAGLPQKSITLGGLDVSTVQGSVIDVRGGGELVAYRWKSGTGGSVDILDSPKGDWSGSVKYAAGTLVSYGGKTWSARVAIDPADFASSPQPATGLYWTQVPESYAVIPGLDADVAPYNPFNTGSNAGALAGNPGYVSGSLGVGDKIYLDSSTGLTAGYYTLLPRNYALFPGAYLVTPSVNLSNNKAVYGGIATPDGSSTVAGYRFNSFNKPVETTAARSLYEVAPAATVATRASYDTFLTADFMPAATQRNNITTLQKLPRDAGAVSLRGNSSLVTDGNILTSAAGTGRGASIDLASSSGIAIVGGAGIAPIGSGAILNSDEISSWGAASVLIGGLRRETTSGTVIDVRSSKVTLSNSGTTLTSPEILLVSKGSITFDPGSSMIASSDSTPSATSYLVSGDGALAAVSANSGFGLTRSNLAGATTPSLTIGAGSILSGAGVLLDSTYATSIDPGTILNATSLTLSSGQLSILLQPQAGSLPGSAISPHLVLKGNLLAQAQNSASLTLGSYSSIDIYGSGTFGSAAMKQLRFRAGGDNTSTPAQELSLRGWNQGGGTATFLADSVSFENPSSTTALAASVNPLSGTFQVQSKTITFGSNNFGIGSFQNTILNADSGILSAATGTFSTAGDLNLTSPLIAGAASSIQSLTAGGQLNLNAAPGTATVASGLGASLALQGTSVTANSKILLPSGLVTITATAGNVLVGGQIDVSGTSRSFYDLTRYSDAGGINISASAGQVRLLAGSLVSVSASRGGGNAGQVTIDSQGVFESSGILSGDAAAGGTSGSFLLDAGSLPSFTSLTANLDAGGFEQERNLRIRTGSVEIGGLTHVRKFTLSTDAGSISVSGTIDAHGKTGGEIHLVARENITLLPTAFLNASGTHFNSAGKGGSISIEAGSESNGVVSSTALLDIQSGSRIDLSVSDYVAGAYTDVGSSAFHGQYEGTLALRAPQRTVAGNLGVAVSQLSGEIVGASSILVEGYKIFTVTGATGQITGSRTSISALPATGTTERLIYNNGVAFLGSAGSESAGYSAMVDSLLGTGDPKNLGSLLVLAPGAEIINTTANGDITLGNSSSNWSFDWNLADYRFGPKSAPGVLTIRGSGNIVFWNTLSDGFTAVSPTQSGNGNSSMWLAPLMDINPLLPVNTQSWSFRITSGADLTAADAAQVLKSAALGANKGSVRIGKTVSISGSNNTTAGVIGTSSLTRFQVIRTGTGNIQISSARDIKLLNPFAAVYTAGVRIPDPNSIYSANDFVTPQVNTPNGDPSQTSQLGPPQQEYSPQWSMAGGDISLAAKGSMGRYSVSGSTDVVDSSKEMPNNWLYRRGYVDGGLFGVAGVDADDATISDPSASTAWWIDFSNFFEGVGALGGGNINLKAGQDIINLDAAIPTNARAAGLSGSDRLAPDPNKFLELGGGDLEVQSGRDISGGVYYVERGSGNLFAGASIMTNSSRSPKSGGDSLTWLPTTLFVGKSSFNVSARKDVLLGPVVNTFWLPQGLQNKFWYKTYFTTYSPDSSLSVSSLGGSITNRQTTVDSTLVSATSGAQNTQPILSFWLSNQNLFRPKNPSASQPWIRLAEGNVDDLNVFSTVGSIMPPNLRETSFAGDVNVVGKINLFPASNGSLELAAAGMISGLNPVGHNAAKTFTAYSSGSINLSDADPAALPSALAPYALQSTVGTSLSGLRSTAASLLTSVVDNYFSETGSYAGIDSGIIRKKTRHDSGILHLNDTKPVLLYATGGDITGLTLFAPKVTRVAASRDITDITFYLQNSRTDDVTIVSAGRNIIPFNESSSIRSVAADITKNNIIVDLNQGTTVAGKSTKALAGDIQIGGKGTLEVLAGQKLDLGTGENLSDGRGAGITSIGNSRNPYLPFAGANLIVMAGVEGKSGGPAIGLASSSLTFKESAGGVTSEADAISALAEFYATLVSAADEFTKTGSYAIGFAAIDKLFGATSQSGDIFTRARDIRTTTGGSITMAAPGGGLTMASTISGNPLTPPGIVTEYGGAVSVFTKASVDIGQARIFTLRGGDLTIWSSEGDIAAGSAPKTVVTAPPTRVLIDTTSAEIETDLGGLATGGGIGVLASVEGVAPGNVTLIAPSGTVDAGDAGIRATGNITIAAVSVLNADNIAAGGTTAGVPSAPAVAAPNISGLSSGSASSAAANSAANSVSSQARDNTAPVEEAASDFKVEVLGYGGGENDEG